MLIVAEREFSAHPEEQTVPDDLLESLHLRLVDDPTSLLELLQQEPAGPTPIEISRSRGNMPVYVDHRNNGAPLEASSVTLICNAGAFNHNSPDYSRARSSVEAAATIRFDDEGDGPLLYSFSNPGDTVVIGSSDERTTRVILDRIRESFATIGVALASDIEIVPSIDEYMQANPAPNRLLPHVSDPRMMAYIGAGAGIEPTMVRTGLINSGFYEKTAFQRVMEANGVATPPTHHGRRNAADLRAHAEAIYNAFPDYDNVIISDAGGLGGKSVHDVPRDVEAIMELLSNREIFKEGVEVMSQGKLPLIVSPCLRANIGDDFIEITGVSIQRFIGPGKYSGNICFEGIFEYLHELAPDFMAQNSRTLQVMQQMGVRGQINLDSMVVSEDNRIRLGLQGQTNMREANVRPAYSTADNAAKRGDIDGKPILNTLLNSKIDIPYKVFMDPRFMQILHSLNTANTRTLLVNYDADPGTQKAFIIFAGTEDVSIDELSKKEEYLMKAIEAMTLHYH